MIRISKIIIGLMAAFLLLLPACTEPMSEGVENGITNASALTLSLFVDGMGLEISTRATMEGTTSENKVNTIHLFFFEPSNNGTGKFVDVIKLSPLSNLTDIPTQGTGISASDAYRVIGVANADDYMSSGWDAKSQWEGKSETDFRQNTITKNVTTFSSGNLLMNGTAVKTAGNGLIEMKLIRNVVRVDVIFKDNPNIFTFENAQLHNVYKQSSITGDETTLKYTSSTARGGVSALATPVKDSDGQSIKAKLYAFENKVTSPSQTDNITTCVIVKLKCTDSDPCGYFRININPKDEAQNLRRNNVYSISINKVNGVGYGTFEEALEGTKENELDYTINNWVDDKGLIVADSYSILALPVKVAQIGKEGGTFEYIITTFSTLESPSPLKIKNETLDNGLTVSLDGNTLKVVAIPLVSEDQVRNGKVTLTYAGLEATMDIEQSLKANAFLKIVYAENWSGLLPATAGNETKNIQVFASGPWKATIIGDDGFSFSSGSTDMASTATTGDFKVRTVSDNPSKTSRRNAFVIVSLDADPINCVAVVSLAQTTAGTITISPLTETVVFDGSQSNLTTGSNVQTFTVNISEGALSATITENPGKFAYSLNGSTLKIYTLSANNSASSVYGKLKLSGGGSELILNLVQKPLLLSVITSNPTTVECEGGKTGSFYLSDDTDCKVSLNVYGVERNVYNHGVRLVDESGNVVSQGVTFNSQTKLKVQFDKIAFPNREIEIKATVTYTTSAGGTASYTFTQNKLKARGVNIWNLREHGYGSLYSSHYIDKYRDAINVYKNSFVSVDYPTSSYPANTTYIHVGNQFASKFNWTYVKNFLANEDGIVVLTNDEGGTSLSKGNELLSYLGYSNAIDPKKTPSITVANGTSSSRVGEFMTTYGKTKISNPVGIPKFYSNSILTYMPKGGIGTGVALLTSNNDNEVYLMVDPVKKFVYIGEVEVFNHDSHLTNGRKDFMNNFVQYVVNAARYGSHFTDMLIEGNGLTPWDAVWGDNRWPLRSN